MAQYSVPAGPLSAYLGVRSDNEESDRKEIATLGALLNRQDTIKQRQAEMLSRSQDRAAALAQHKELVGLQMQAQKDALAGRLGLQEQMNQQRHEENLRRAANDTERLAETARRNREKADFDRQMLDLKGTLAGQTATREQDRNVQQLGTALERANLPQANSVLGAVEKAMTDVPDLPAYISGPKSLMPDLLVPSPVAEGRQAFQKLFNITLKDRSGAAVTNPELERLKQEFATGAWKTADQIKAGVSQTRKIINDHYRSVAAGFGTDTVKGYNENLKRFGGSPIINFDELAPTAPTVPSGLPPPPPGFKMDR